MAGRPYLDPRLTRHDTHSAGFLSTPTTPSKDSIPFSRPLSDIREITEPSIVEGTLDEHKSARPSSPLVPPPPTAKPADKQKRTTTVRIVEPASTANSKHKREAETQFSSSTPTENSLEETPSYSSPHVRIPQRSSSERRREGSSRAAALRPLDADNAPRRRELLQRQQLPRESSPETNGFVQQYMETSHARTVHIGPPPSFVRDSCAFDIAEDPNIHHPRVAAQLQVVAPLFVSGGSIEGFVRIKVDYSETMRQRRSIIVSSAAVDLLGVEDLVGQHRRSVFMDLATELFTVDHPPPTEAIESEIPVSSRAPQWLLKPCLCAIPFRIGLPLDVGPAPFKSRSARIRYLLSTTVQFTEDGVHAMVRDTQEIAVLSTYDPERALRSLPSPLTAFDEVHMSRGGFLDVIRLTAGLHRQVWVSGTNLFVDVHISNSSDKHLKKLELSIERDILYYRHATVSTLENPSSQTRIFQDREQTSLSREPVKLGKAGWNGVAPMSNIIRTCQIDLPRGHATIRCGKFFEVRFFLNVTIGTSHMYARIKAIWLPPHTRVRKYLFVQLPIILIHMNSLDVVPNAVGQVAVAIEEKRARCHQRIVQPQAPSERQHKSYKAEELNRSKSEAFLRLQGKAFAAPRKQSLERTQASAADVEELAQAIQRSPRRRRSRHTQAQTATQVNTSSMGTRQRPSSRTRGVEQHRFALHDLPLAQSSNHIGAGSYTVLNGSDLHTSIIPDRRRAVVNAKSSGVAQSMKRTVRSMRSLETLKHLTSRSLNASYMYSQNHERHAILRPTRAEDDRPLNNPTATMEDRQLHIPPSSDDKIGTDLRLRRPSRSAPGENSGPHNFNRFGNTRFESRGVSDRSMVPSNGLTRWIKRKGRDIKVKDWSRSGSAEQHSGEGGPPGLGSGATAYRSGWI